ncbi:hypothetical protein HDU98_003217 [Podochytrium sp. JEL0797]|nr:hypothetical protein HDU98_003217 [Podochytrium sp. JEL0797]
MASPDLQAQPRILRHLRGESAFQLLETRPPLTPPQRFPANPANMLSSTAPQDDPPKPSSPIYSLSGFKTLKLDQRFLAKYELTGVLGVGGYSFVCSARRKADGMEVAVKFIVKKCVTTWFEDKVLGRIPMEVHILQSISHESIVCFIDYFQDPKFCYLVMELFGSTWQKDSSNRDTTPPKSTTLSDLSKSSPTTNTPPESCTRSDPFDRRVVSDPSSDHPAALGPPVHTHPRQLHLSDMMRSLSKPSHHRKTSSKSKDLYECIEHTRFDNSLARHAFKQIMSAVAYLHSLNISHRDLKDENIVIDDAFRLKLVDFGSAVVEEENVEEGIFVYRDRFQGTVLFAPPEVLAGFRYRTKPADIWACGILLYTILCGETPFSASNQVVSEPFKLPRNECSSDAVDLMSWLLSKDPRTRPTSQQVLDHEWLKETEGK